MKIMINKIPKVPFISENEKNYPETKQGKKQIDTIKKIRNRKEKKCTIKRKQTERQNMNKKVRTKKEN